MSFMSGLRRVLSAGNKAVALLACLLALPASLYGQKSRELGEVVVTGQRPMKEIGIQKTAIDSAALKENISQSMADILTYQTSLYVKNYGRATTSTVAFRGTSPSHTQVTWNGLRISSPMLGMTDFSAIPAYFVDQAAIYHGPSSVNETGGGLGGLVKLTSNPDMPPGWNLQYVQGIGSFFTFDEFLRAGYSNDKWTVSTRAAYASSPNDYKYINHDKKVNIYDENHNVIGQYHPEERNRSGAYKDLNVMQEVYYNTLKGDRLGLSFWYADSNRELPLLTTDYGDERQFENRQREQTFRGVVMWNHSRRLWKLGLKAGYVHTWLAYDYRREITQDNWAVMTRSRSRVNTIFGQAEWEWQPTKRWFFNATLSAHQQMVRSADKNVILQQGDKAVVGYDKARIELSGSLSAKWQPIDRIGLSAVVREDMYGTKWSAVIPALFVDALLTRDGRLTAKASMTTNYRFPSLNDLYFMPGGNPNLKNERGVSYDGGLAFHCSKPGLIALDASATWFDSYINDWIMWLPTPKGFYSPRNVKKVHAYGVELAANIGLQPFSGWLLDLNATYSWTPSVNTGERMSAGDMSVGKQLPYVPRNSSAITGRLSWKNWSFLYKWCWYSERYTMSSNDFTLTGRLPDYFMSNVSLEKNISFKPLDLQLKAAVNNLFNEDYQSVLGRPMPGINFEFFVGITPHF